MVIVLYLQAAGPEGVIKIRIWFQTASFRQKEHVQKKEMASHCLQTVPANDMMIKKKKDTRQKLPECAVMDAHENNKETKRTRPDSFRNAAGCPPHFFMMEKL